AFAMRLKQMTLMKMASPGKSTGHQIPEVSGPTPSAIIPPQVGVGGATPMPRKLSEEIASSAVAAIIAVCARLSSVTFGRTCRRRMRGEETQYAFAASTYWDALTASTSLRTTRMNDGAA